MFLLLHAIIPCVSLIFGTAIPTSFNILFLHFIIKTSSLPDFALIPYLAAYM